MRPIQLTIAGLNSFREPQIIDFESLAGLGLFGIFGPTGSGKSSILDAMTLALYGEVGRAGNHTQGILNHAESRVHVRFDFSVGTVGHRRTFRVERHYKRGDDVSVLHHASRLVEMTQDGTDEVLADSKNEVTKRIKEVLGLEPSDFTRAVVLPQGKFAEFLQLSGVERNRMTERLFGLERYGQRLVERIAIRERDVKNELDTVVRLLEQIGDASPEALAALERELEGANHRVASAAKALHSLDEELDGTRRLRRDTAELDAVMQKWEAHRAGEPEIRRIESQLERSALALPIMEAAATLEASEENHRAISREEKRAADDVEEARQRVRAAISEQRLCEQTRAEEEPKLLARLEGLNASMALADELHGLDEALTEAQASREACQSKLAAVQAAHAQETQRVADVHMALEAAQRELAASMVSPDERQTLNALSPLMERARGIQEAMASHRVQLQQRRLARTDRRAQLDKLSARMEAINAEASEDSRADALVRWSESDVQSLVHQTTLFLDHWHECQRHHHQVVEAGEARKALETAFARTQKAVVDAETALAEAEARLNERMVAWMSWRERDQQRLASEWAMGLAEGQPCPVCGSTTHPHPAQSLVDMDVDDSHEASDGAAVQALQSTVNAKREHAQRCVGERADVQARLESSTQSVHRLNADEEAAHARALRLLEVLASSWESLHAKSNPFPSGVPETVLADMDEKHILGALDCVQQEHATRIEAYENAEALRGRREETRAALADEITAARAEQRAEEREIERLLVQEGDIVRTHTEVLTTIQSLLQRYGDAPNLDDVLVEAERWQQGLFARDKSYDAWGRQVTKVRLQLDEGTRELQTLLSQLGDTRLQCLELDNRVNQLQQRRDAVRAHLLPLLDGASSLEDAVHAVKLRLERFNAQLLRCGKAVDECRSEERKAEIALASLVERKEGAVKEVAVRRRAFEALLAASVFRAFEEVAASRLETDVESSYAAHVTQYGQDGKLLEDLQRTLEDKLGGQRVTAQALQALEAKREALVRVHADAMIESGRVLEAHRNLVTQNEQWARLTHQREALDSDWRRWSDLKTTVRGNSFVEFVAKGQLERVAHDASVRLARLTRGRYALEITGEGGFVMADLHNGGIRRPVSTLSGGETFLTSLALALSLSSQIQLRGQYPLEFFFLDEGFGTLDPELLDTVISTLEQLHLENFVIGLISHVPELRQRLTRRLIVEPALPGGRGTRVRVEQA